MKPVIAPRIHFNPLGLSTHSQKSLNGIKRVLNGLKTVSNA